MNFLELKTILKEKYNFSPKTFQCHKPVIKLIDSCDDEIINKMINANMTYQEISYCIINDIDYVPTCKYCGSKLKFIKLSKGYRKTCGSKQCSRRSVEETCLMKYGVKNGGGSIQALEKIKNTCLKKYGVENPLQDSDIRKRIQKTCLDKYGTKTPFENKDLHAIAENSIRNKFGAMGYASEEIKNKAYNTTIEKFGTPFVIQLNEFKEHFKKVSIEKYGTEHPFQNESVKQKWKDVMISKYGVIHHMHIDEVKQSIQKTCIEKYGVNNPAKDSNIKNKIRETNKLKYGINEYTGNVRLRPEHQLLSQMYNTLIRNSLKNNLIPLFDEEHFIITKGHSEYKWQCKKCGNIINNYYNKKIPICKKCKIHGISSGELDLLNYIKSIYSGKIITNCRNLIYPYEIDIYIPELKIGFEYNGEYWHSIEYKSENYHLDKTEMCFDNDILLMHIFENDWNNNKDVIKEKILNMITNKNCITDNTIFELDRTFPIILPSKLFEMGYILHDIIPPQKISNSKYEIYDCGKMIFKNINYINDIRAQ